MFTGIVRELGTVVLAERAKGITRLAIDAPKLAPVLQPLDSLAVNGVCLSVVTVRQPLVTCDVIRETLTRTTLGTVRRGDRVNLEPSLLITDRLNGHMVFGHVDGVGVVTSRQRAAGEHRLRIRVATGLRSWLVPKGPVTLDGVSLTVGAALTPTTFTVHLIPETLRLTTLGSCGPGTRLNIEIDYFAKLLRQFMRSNGH